MDDCGHLGAFGLLYTDSPPKIVTRGEYREIYGASYLSVLTGYQAGKWWYARDLGG